MPEPTTPPTRLQSLAAGGVGGFGGAALGVVAAASLMGDNDNGGGNGGQMAIEAAQLQQVEIVAAENHDTSEKDPLEMR